MFLFCFLVPLVHQHNPTVILNVTRLWTLCEMGTHQGNRGLLRLFPSKSKRHPNSSGKTSTSGTGEYRPVLKGKCITILLYWKILIRNVKKIKNKMCFLLTPSLLRFLQDIWLHFAEATFHVLFTQDNRRENAASRCSLGGDGGDERPVPTHTCPEKHRKNGSSVNLASTEVSVDGCEEDADSSQVSSTSNNPPDPSK